MIVGNFLCVQCSWLQYVCCKSLQETKNDAVKRHRAENVRVFFGIEDHVFFVLKLTIASYKL